MADEHPDYLSATKKCDIVMKGGLTSGVVYPNTVVKLAEIYRFMNIGGTSAGAIAAAATAAAEYRRSHGNGYGFERLSELPAFLAATPAGKKHTNLFWLFQPDPDARMLFDVGVSLTKKGWTRWRSLLWSLIKGSPIVWIAWALVATLYYRQAQSAFDAALATLGLIAILVIALSAVLARTLRRLPGRGFGICPGTTRNLSAPPALTEWLNDYLNDLAGKRTEEPLTFGDLRGQGIQLRMISTCVTHGRPYGLPIDSAQFYFKEDELREYFPASVVEWMKNHPSAGTRSGELVDTSGFCRLPGPSEMPVVVAARMSLSFPFLFRAVPLYAIDYSLHRSDQPVKPEPGGALQPDEPRRPERCWFMDGGVCSNFPMHMFDAPLPRWPTFGVDLEDLRKDRPASFVWMPSQNEEGLGEQWNRIPESSAVGPIGKYTVSLINAARNWVDNRQMTVPGYRDRIVHIRLDEEKEGGLNLDMKPGDVAKISSRGLEAADLLISHFANPRPDITLTWDNHRWIRLRSVLARLEELFGQLQRGWSNPEPGERSYNDLLQRGPEEPPESYRLTAGQRNFITGWLLDLMGVTQEVGAAAPNVKPSRKAPRPAPDLRVLPRIVPASDVDLRNVPAVDPETEGVVSVSEPE